MVWEFQKCVLHTLSCSFCQYSYFEDIVFDQFDYFGYVMVFQSIMATKSPMPFVLGMELEYVHTGVN